MQDDHEESDSAAPSEQAQTLSSILYTILQQHVIDGSQTLNAYSDVHYSVETVGEGNNAIHYVFAYTSNQKDPVGNVKKELVKVLETAGGTIGGSGNRNGNKNIVLIASSATADNYKDMENYLHALHEQDPSMPEIASVDGITFKNDKVTSISITPKGGNSHTISYTK